MPTRVLWRSGSEFVPNLIGPKFSLWKREDRASVRKGCARAKAIAGYPLQHFVKCATLEALCTPCAEYALVSYDGAREIKDPIDERLIRFEERINRFERKHLNWARLLGMLPRSLLARWFGVFGEIIFPRQQPQADEETTVTSNVGSGLRKTGRSAVARRVSSNGSMFFVSKIARRCRSE
jgi:hypothetical protein